MNPGKPDMMTIRVELGDDEVAERAQRLANAIAQRDARETERTDTNRKIKMEVDRLDMLIRDLSEAVRTRTEDRDVQGSLFDLPYDPTTGEVTPLRRSKE